MSWLTSWLADIAHGIAFWFRETIKEAVKFATTMWGFLLVIAACIYAVLQDTVGAINQIATVLGNASVSNGTLHPSGASALWLLQVCNTFTPLDEIIAYSVTYFTLVGAFGLYRLIKSWIPGGFAAGS